MERKLHFSSISPKTTFYNSNGTGRDTYIVYDSGGCIKTPSRDLPKIKSNVGNFQYKDHKIFHSIRKNNNITHYASDGSGRDKYIIVNEGGLSYPYESKNYHEALFSNSLRNYDRIRVGDTRDFFKEAQRCKTSKEAQQDRMLRNSQKELVFRLTTPKFNPRCYVTRQRTQY